MRGGGRPGERGSVLVLVLLALSVLGVVAAALLSLAVTERTAVDNSLRGSQAYYQAEAGVRYAVARLAEEPYWRGAGFAGLAVGRGRVAALAFTEEITTLKLRSTGEAAGLQRPVEARLLKPALGGTQALLAAAGPGEPPGSILTLSNLVISGDLVFAGTVEVKTNSRVRGNVLAGGHVLMTGGTVDGNVVAGGSVPVKTGIKGSVQENAVVYLPEVPEVDAAYLEWYRQAAAAGGAVYVEEGREDWVLGVADLNSLADSLPGGRGIVYVDGDLTIEDQGTAGPYRGRLTLAATGAIEVEEDLVREDSEECSLVLVAGGDIDIGNHTIEAVALAGEGFKATGNPGLVGVVAAAAVDLGGMAGLTYDPGLVGLAQAGLPPPVFRLVEWRKVAY